MNKKIDKGKALRLWILFRSTFLVGVTTFGGGLSMVAQMSHEFVDRRGWLTEKDMADYLALSQSLPGVVAINMSIFLGYRLGGAGGALVAALGSALPSLIVLCIVTLMYEAFVESRIVLGALRGIRGGVAALLFSVVWRLGKESIAGVWGFILCGGAFCLLFFLDINPIWVLLGGGFLGALMAAYKLCKEKTI